MSRAWSHLLALVAVVAGRAAAADPLPDDIAVSGLSPPAIARVGEPRWQQASGAAQLDARFEHGLVVGADGGPTVRIWSSTDRRLLWQASTSSTPGFALSADGTRIAIGGGVDLAIIEWRTGKQLAKLTSGGAWQVAWSPDGVYLAYGNAGLHVVDLHGTAAYEAAGVRPLRIAFASARRLLYATATGIFALDLSAPGNSPITVSTSPLPIRAAAFSADGALAVWTDGQRVARVDLATGKQTNIHGWTGGAIAAVAVAVNGSLAIYGTKQLAITDDAAAVVWKQAVAPTAGRAVAFSADGKHLVYGGRWLREVMLGANGPVLAPDREASRFVRFSDSETVLVRHGKDHGGALTLASGVWAATALPTIPRPAGAPAWVDRWQVTSTGRMIGWSAAETNTCKPLRVWAGSRDVKTFTLAHCRDSDPAIGNDAGAAPWTIQDRFVITGSAPITLYDATSGKKLGALPPPAEAMDAGEYGHHGPEVRHRVAFAGDGVHVLVVGSLGVEMRALGHPGPLWEAPPLADDREVEVAAFTPDSCWVLLGLHDGSVLIYATATGEARPPVQLHASPIDNIALSPDGALVATTDRDDQTYIWTR